MTSTETGSETGSETGPARPTRQRKAIAATLSSVEEFRSAQEIHDLLKKDGETIGLSTVYRTLQGLADSGEVDTIRTGSGEALYRRCSANHHHHLVCRDCGRTVEVEGPTVETWTRSVAAAHGFSEVSHTLELFGTCPDCH